MLSTSAVALTAYAPTSMIAQSSLVTRSVPAKMEITDKAGMESLAVKLNPSLGFWDPLSIVDSDVSPETIGWFRHAEIKHGRVAMAAFVGYCVQANGIHFPGLLDKGGVSYADISAAGSPGDQWDALPLAGKLQIIGAIGILEFIGENSEFLEANGQKHYVRGGKPGYYPPFNGYINNGAPNTIPHPAPLNLFDPAGLTAKLSPERKEKALLAEINNGRLAMIGIMGLLSASKGLIVPGLDSLGLAQYGGEYMAPLTSATTAALYS